MLLLFFFFFFVACLFFLVFFMGREDSKFYECITEDLAENMNEANSRSMTWFKRKILFLLMQSIMSVKIVAQQTSNLEKKTLMN